MYLLFTSLLIIASLVADVPIPLPFICSLKSSSSISCPAFSMARIRVPEVYLLGADVSPSFISKPLQLRTLPFLRPWIYLRASSGSYFALSSSEESCDISFMPLSPAGFSAFLASFSACFFAKFLSAIIRYPGFTRALKLAKKCSSFLSN